MQTSGSRLVGCGASSLDQGTKYQGRRTPKKYQLKPRVPRKAGLKRRGKPSFFAKVTCAIGCRELPGPCQECIVLMKKNPKNCRAHKWPRKPSYYANGICDIGCRDLPEPCEACLARQKRRQDMRYWGQHRKRVRESKAAGTLLLLCDAQQATTSLLHAGEEGKPIKPFLSCSHHTSMGDEGGASPPPTAPENPGGMEVCGVGSDGGSSGSGIKAGGSPSSPNVAGEEGKSIKPSLSCSHHKSMDNEGGASPPPHGYPL